MCRCAGLSAPLYHVLPQCFCPRKDPAEELEVLAQHPRWGRCWGGCVLVLGRQVRAPGGAFLCHVHFWGYFRVMPSLKSKPSRKTRVTFKLSGSLFCTVIHLSLQTHMQEMNFIPLIGIPCVFDWIF